MNFTKYGKLVDSRQLILDDMTMQKRNSLTTKKLDIKKKTLIFSKAKVTL